MKKSTIYHMAQLSVLNNYTLNPEEKLEILRELSSQESLNKFVEEQELKDAQKSAEQESAE